jgi:hypothetical protein
VAFTLTKEKLSKNITAAIFAAIESNGIVTSTVACPGPVKFCSQNAPALSA